MKKKMLVTHISLCYNLNVAKNTHTDSEKVPVTQVSKRMRSVGKIKTKKRRLKS